MNFEEEGMINYDEFQVIVFKATLEGYGEDLWKDLWKADSAPKPEF